MADHVQRVLKSNFAAAWEELEDDGNEAEETYFLTKFTTVKGQFSFPPVSHSGSGNFRHSPPPGLVELACQAFFLMQGDVLDL